MQGGARISSPLALLVSQPSLPTAQRPRAGPIIARKANRPGPKSEPARRARASDILLTRNAYKIEPGWACRAEPASGVGDVPPQPGAASSRLCRAARMRRSWRGGLCCGHRSKIPARLTPWRCCSTERAGEARALAGSVLRPDGRSWFPTAQTPVRIPVIYPKRR
jgi:hypothetical protein